MLHNIRTNYKHTIYASYIGYITQAIVNNFVPLLFLTFVEDFGLTLEQITFITTLNFAVQLTIDFLATKFVDFIGYRKAMVGGHLVSALGLFGLSFVPQMIGCAYAGVLLCVVLYAIGGGIMEVLVSPVVEACPTKEKEGAMSLLHSFYCWGHVAVVLLSTAFFALCGISNWKVLVCLWALIPLFNAVYFSQVPIYPIGGEQEKMSLGKMLKQKVFWLLIILMICAGASEQAVSQWASAFAESALGVSKTIGDLAGPCTFAILMGTSRAIYGKYSSLLPLKKMMVGSGILCVASYLLTVFAPHPILSLVGCGLCGFSVGIFWPGTFSMAAISLPGAGTAMYALMALAGDVGCSGGPTVVGLVADAMNGDLKKGILVAILFPVVITMGLFLLKTPKRN
ncbi:MAG: MFS transporter [Lachnospiraceae bacterium]|nr:MFS transporter [Lachnospiraceae bacterium]